MDEQSFTQLNQKLQMLEGQVTNLLGYVSNPQGELFASALQVHRIEETVTRQQSTMLTIESKLKTFQEGLATYLDQTYQQITSQKGSRGLDLQLLTKFMSASLAEAISSVKEQIKGTLQDSIPLRKLQDLERHVLMKQQMSGLSAPMEDFRVSRLESRVGLLEQKQIPEVKEPTINVDPLLERIQHVEQELLKQVEKAYKTAGTTSGPGGGPFAQLESRVLLLDKEFQSFRGATQPKLLEGMISASVQNAKAALEQQLATKVSIDDFQQQSSTIQRVETFAREVQTGFTRMRQDYETARREVADALQQERLDEFRNTRLKLEQLHVTLETELNSCRLMMREFSRVNRTLAELRDENKELLGSWLEAQLEETQKTLKLYNDQKMQVIRYQLANEVEKIVKDDFETFFSKKSIALIHSHVETQLPEKVKLQVQSYMKEFDVATKPDIYEVQKKVSRVDDSAREANTGLKTLQEKISKQIDLFLQQFNTFGKALQLQQTEVGKLQKQVQGLSLQVKELQVNVFQEQKKFENHVLDLLMQYQNGRTLDHIETLRPPPPKIVPSKPQPPAQTSAKSELLYKSLTKVFYTAIFGKDLSSVDTLGDFDKLPGWDYICFTNLEFKGHRGWKCIHVPLQGDPVVQAKYYKWMSHKVLGDYDVAVWMDGYLSPNLMYSELLKHWIVSMAEQNICITHRPHATRSCIWDECQAVVESRRAKPDQVQSVMRSLEAIRMPRNYGLYDTNILIRFHKHMLLQHLSEEIWQALDVCPRDQLAVTMVYYKNNFIQFQLQNLIRAFTATGEHKRINAY